MLTWSVGPLQAEALTAAQSNARYGLLTSAFIHKAKAPYDYLNPKTCLKSMAKNTQKEPKK